MGVMLRTPNGAVHYATGTFTKEIETVDEQNMTAFLIAWQGGDGTIHPISDAQWANNQFGTPVEWFVSMLSGLATLGNQARDAANAARDAANAAAAAAGRAEAAAVANQAGIGQAAAAAENARSAAVAAAAEAHACLEAVEQLGHGTGGGPVTIEVYAGLPGTESVKLGNVVVDTPDPS
jgi:hypothetical protein